MRCSGTPCLRRAVPCSAAASHVPAMRLLICQVAKRGFYERHDHTGQGVDPVLRGERVPRLLPHQLLPYLENFRNVRFEVLAELTHGRRCTQPRCRRQSAACHVLHDTQGGCVALVNRKGLRLAPAAPGVPTTAGQRHAIAMLLRAHPSKGGVAELRGYRRNGHARRAASDSVPEGGATLAAFRIAGSPAQVVTLRICRSSSVRRTVKVSGIRLSSTREWTCGASPDTGP